MKRQFERVRVCRQKSSPYRATGEIDRLLQAGHEVVIEGGKYVAHLVLTTLKEERFYLPYTDSRPYVYPPSQRTLQEALDTLDVACLDALAASPPERVSPRRDGPPMTWTEMARVTRGKRPPAPIETQRAHLPSPFSRPSDHATTRPEPAAESPSRTTTE